MAFWRNVKSIIIIFIVEIVYISVIFIFIDSCPHFGKSAVKEAAFNNYYGIGLVSQNFQE